MKANRYSIENKDNTKRNRVVLAFSSNENGGLMLGISLYSALVSKRTDTQYIIYILNSNISDATCSKLKEMVEAYSCELHFLPVDHLLDEHLHKDYSVGLPRTTFARLFLPDLLPQENRVIYLDIDLLILKDLRDLFESPLDGALAGVVYQQKDDFAVQQIKRLGMRPTSHYFNAGVMLMDLALMRQESINNALITYLVNHENDLSYLDQDVLNAVLEGRVRGLHPKWNWAPWPVLRPRKKAIWGELGKAKAIEAALEPAILHFFGGNKTTRYNDNFYRNLYRQYWLNSPWRDVPMSGEKRWYYLAKCIEHIPKELFLRLQMWWLRRKWRRSGYSDSFFAD